MEDLGQFDLAVGPMFDGLADDVDEPAEDELWPSPQLTSGSYSFLQLLGYLGSGETRPFTRADRLRTWAPRMGAFADRGGWTVLGTGPELSFQGGRGGF